MAFPAARRDQDEVMAQYARAKVGWAQVPETDEPKPSVKDHINELYAKAGITDRKL